MNIGMPQLIMLGIYMLNVGISMARHGEHKRGKENAFGAIIGAGIGIALLNWGGFFS